MGVFIFFIHGATSRTRTDDLPLTRRWLYQLSYCGEWWLDPELNRGHMDFQSIALPTELSSLKSTIMKRSHELYV